MCLYLKKREGVYYFRRVIPTKLRSAFDGAREFTFSLDTKNKDEAKRKRDLEAVRTTRLLDEARASLGAPDTSEAAPAPTMRTLTEWEIEQVELERQEMAESEDAGEELATRIEFLEDRLKGSTRQMPHELRAFARILRGREFDNQLLRDQLLAARAELAERRHSLTPDVASQPPSEAPQSTAAQATGETGMLLIADEGTKDIVDLWAAERKVPAQTESMYRAAARWLYERVGRKPVDQLTKQDVAAFKAKLVADGHSNSNIKNKLSRLRTLLQWAMNNGYASFNAADGVTIADTGKRKKARLPFDLASLNAIFGSPVYLQGMRPVAGCGEAAYWLPLLALFTGARREELGQLRPDDVLNLAIFHPDGHEETAWFIRLIEVADDEDEGEASTKIKNEESERLIPVHPELERLGFIALAQAMKEQGHPRIFHLLKPNKFDVYTDAWGKWFTRYRRGACGIIDKRLTFHSFRHTFIDYARRPDIPEGVQRQLVGHSGGDVHDTTYGTGYGLYWLVEGMRRYKVPGLKVLPG